MDSELDAESETAGPGSPIDHGHRSTSGDTPSTGTRARGRFDRRCAGLLALLLAPFAALLVRIVVMGSYFSASDVSLIQFRVQDVFTGDTPLVGVYSRYGWNHPGPLLFYVLAVPFRLLGSTSKSLLAADVLVNAAAVAAIGWLCWRRGRIGGLLLGGTITLLLLRSLGGGLLFFPWNPFVVVMPMFLLALLVWSVACRDYWLLPVAVFVASFVIQAHIGSTVPALTLLAVALIAFVIEMGRRRVAEPWLVLATSAVTGLLCWAAPLVEQVQPGGGNLSAIRDFWGEDQTRLGAEPAARVIAAQLSLPAPWITSHEQVSLFTGGVDPGWHIPFALIGLVIALLVAWERRDRESFALGLVALAFVEGAWFAVSGVIDIPFSYLMKWTWIAGALPWLAIGWTAMRALSGRVTPGQRKIAVSAGVAAMTVLSVMTVGSAARAQPSELELTKAMRVVKDPVRAAVRDVPGPVVVGATPALDSVGLAHALALDLTNAGYDVGLAPETEFAVGPRHVVEYGAAQTAIYVGTGRIVPGLDRDPKFRKLAGYDTASPEDRAWADKTEEMLDALEPVARLGWPLENSAEWKRLERIRNNEHRFGVYIAGPDIAGEISRRTAETK